MEQVLSLALWLRPVFLVLVYLRFVSEAVKISLEWC